MPFNPARISEARTGHLAFTFETTWAWFRNNNVHRTMHRKMTGESERLHWCQRIKIWCLASVVIDVCLGIQFNISKCFLTHFIKYLPVGQIPWPTHHSVSPWKSAFQQEHLDPLWAFSQQRRQCLTAPCSWGWYTQCRGHHTLLWISQEQWGILGVENLWNLHIYMYYRSGSFMTQRDTYNLPGRCLPCSQAMHNHGKNLLSYL